MFGCIKRLINWEGVKYDSRWDKLDNDEMLSLIASNSSESEIPRLDAVLAKSDTRSLKDISRITVTSETTGLMFFSKSEHPVFFFVQVQED
jgi:hypothetical protein